MTHALCIVAWTCLSLLIEPLMKLKGMGPRNVVEKALDEVPAGHQFPEFVLWIVILSAGGLLAWSFTHMRWYLVVMEWFLGIVLSAVLSPAGNKVLLVKYGWIPPLATAVGLWFLPTAL